MRLRAAALIWCPTSNLNLFGRTVSRTVLRSGIPIALATDSALSAHADLLDELAVARRYVPSSRLLDLVTTQPARILGLPDSHGRRDWIAVRSWSTNPVDALLHGSVALVVVRGRIRLISEELARQLPPVRRRCFQPFAVEGREPVLVDADVRAPATSRQTLPGDQCCASPASGCCHESRHSPAAGPGTATACTL
jgi:hypothetical protein